MAKFSDTMVPAQNMTKMSAFYQEAFQLEPIEVTNDYTKLRDRTSGQIVVITNGPCAPGISLGFETSDTEKLKVKLTSLGGKVGEDGVCFDPEGNPLLVWTPST